MKHAARLETGCLKSRGQGSLELPLHVPSHTYLGLSFHFLIKPFLFLAGSVVQNPGWGGGGGNSRRISSQENHTWGINQRWLQRSQITIFFIGNFMFISFSPQTPLSWHWELLLAAVCICLCARSHHVEHSQSVSMHHTGPDLSAVSEANWFAFVKICCFPCFKINLGARLGNSFHFILHCRLKIHKIILHICLRWTDCQQCKQTPPECLCVYIVTFNF